VSDHYVYFVPCTKHKEASMNSRERVIRAIARTEPDRVPLTHVTLPGAVTRYGAALEALYQRYPTDMFSIGSASTGEFGPQIGVPSRDTWGSLWLRHTDEHKGQVVYCPLADWGALPTFTPPDTASDALFAAMEANLRRNAGIRYTLADGDALWQRMFYLHGYQATLEDLLLERDRCATLRDLILGVMVRRVERLCRLEGLDGVHFRDDWGTQEALMISPALWRSFFLPAYAQLFALVRNAGKQVWFHTDGVTESIIPDLIASGVQVLNPQVNVMGRAKVALLAGAACVEADIDRQAVLPYGTPEEVRAAVRADKRAFDRAGGGYIGRGEAAGDVPLENLEAMLDEITRPRAGA
jgi:uroporphyrinogen decarboxylase